MTLPIVPFMCAPKTNPCGTLGLTFFQLDGCPLKITFCCLSIENTLES